MTSAQSFLPTSILPPYATLQRFNAPLFILYAILHLSLLAAPFTFSWAGLMVFAALSFTTICLGITLCYHRLLAHRSYKVPQFLAYGLAFLGCLAFQRGPIWWVACHRLHHQQVDKPGDPHSPSLSIVWSHFLWAFFRHPQLDESTETLKQLAPEIYADPGFQFLEKYYSAINIGVLVVLFMVGYVIEGLSLALSLLVWGGLLRILYGLHVTWLVNSAAHLWGYRTYATKDSSRNNWWVALLTWGEGWHNNHHFQPRSAQMGQKWYEVDVTYGIIRLLQKAGIATNIVTMT